MPGRGVLRLSPAARQHVREALDYYEAARLGLGRQFLKQLVSTIDAVLEHPRSFPSLHADVRRACFKQFPYGVFFREQDGLLRVIAVIDLRRHERNWQRRS